MSLDVQFLSGYSMADGSLGRFLFDNFDVNHQDTPSSRRRLCQDSYDSYRENKGNGVLVLLLPVLPGGLLLLFVVSAFNKMTKTRVYPLNSRFTLYVERKQQIGKRGALID